MEVEQTARGTLGNCCGKSLLRYHFELGRKFFEVVASNGAKSGIRIFFSKRKDLETKYKFKERRLYDFVEIKSPNNVQLFLDKGKVKKYPFKFMWDYKIKIPERHYFKVNIEKKSTSSDNPGATSYRLSSMRVNNTSYVAGFDHGAYEWWLELIIMKKMELKNPITVIGTCFL